MESPAVRDLERKEDVARFLVRDCLVNDIEFITSVKYEESVWMEECGGRGSSALYNRVCV